MLCAAIADKEDTYGVSLGRIVARLGTAYPTRIEPCGKAWKVILILLGIADFTHAGDVGAGIQEEETAESMLQDGGYR